MHTEPAHTSTPAASDSGNQSAFPIGPIAVMTAVLGLRITGEMAVRIFFNVYMDTALSAPTGLIGLLAAAGQLCSVPAALAAPVLMARWGLPRTYVLVSLVLILCTLPVALVPTWGAAAFSLLGVIATSAITSTAVTVFHQSVVLPQWRTAMSGATSMASGVGQAAVAFGGGYLIATLGYRSFFLSTAALALAGVGLFAAYFRVWRGTGAPQPADLPATVEAAEAAR
jgi:predicted MFS family arabinose efflux permease